MHSLPAAYPVVIVFTGEVAGIEVRVPAGATPGDLLRDAQSFLDHVRAQYAHWPDRPIGKLEAELLREIEDLRASVKAA